MISQKVSWSVTPAKAGVQTSSRRKSGTISKTGSRFSPGTLDSGFRRNDEIYGLSAFYEFINIAKLLDFDDFRHSEKWRNEVKKIYDRQRDN
jgi:hypothetical protein